MTEILNALLKLWPLLESDWRTVVLVFVLLFCALLLVWSGYQRKQDRDLVKREIKALSDAVSELQETLDLVVTIHNDRHPEDGRRFVRKLAEHRSEAKEKESKDG